jgi:hypothetical protein
MAFWRLAHHKTKCEPATSIGVIGDFATVDHTGENGPMNEQIAYALIDAELRRLQERSYSNLSALIGKVDTKECVGEDGKMYYLEIQAFWDSKKGADVRLIVAADDGGWRAYKPLTGTFIMRPDGSLV